MESNTSKQVRKEGYLEMMGGSHRSWKHRYFVLYISSLDYFKDQNQKEKLGTIPLLDSLVGIESTEESGFNFSIRLGSNVQGAKRNEFILQASNQEERALWVSDIEACTIHTIFKHPLLEATKVNPNQFGINLPIPYFLVKAIKYLEDNGELETEGLYRLNGSSTKNDKIV